MADKSDSSADPSATVAAPNEVEQADSKEEKMPEMPKLELKSFAPLLILFGSRYIDLKQEENVNMVRIALGSSFALVLGVYFLIWQWIKMKKNSTEIWLPPKPLPTMPFSPPAPKPDLDKYEPTTYLEYESTQLFEAAKSACFSVAIAIFCSLKFGIHISCLMTACTLPLSFYDNLVCRKYFGLGSGLVYGELLEKPSAAATAAPKKKEKKFLKPPAVPQTGDGDAGGGDDDVADNAKGEDISNID
jgi:hypothetical protein